MRTFRQSSLDYVPPTTKNISELPKFDIGIEIKEKTGKNKEGVEFTYDFIEIEGEEYRVPKSVFGGMKDILEVTPNVEKVTVKKTGEGMNTKYTVVPTE